MRQNSVFTKIIIGMTTFLYIMGNTDDFGDLIDRPDTFDTPVGSVFGQSFF